jgi:hypothetical protein
MTQPAVEITELDGALGVLPASAGRLLALIGPADDGPINTPATFARVKDLIANFGGGPTVQAAAHAIERYGKPVVIVRTAASVEGDYLGEVEAEDGAISAITKTGTGTSTYTDNSSDPLVAAEVKVLFVVGGTRGVAGIVYQISLDAGQAWSPPIALGTDVTFDILSTGASIAISAGDVDPGDFIEFTLTAPILASAGEMVIDVDGSSAPTLTSGTHPNDDYEALFVVEDGGTIGVVGITFRWSLDGGRTMSAVTALGTSNHFIFPNSGGTRIDFAAGDLDDGDSIAFPTVAPCWTAAELGAALDALKVSAINWEIAQVVGPIDGDAFDMVELKIAAMSAVGKYHTWMGNTRLPVGDESEATYLASLTSEFSSKSTVRGALCAGGEKLTSSVDGRKYRRPVSFVAAAREANVSEEIDTADVNLGPFVGVSIRDSNGNPDEHDESSNPGLDDARFYVLRTWDDFAGVYVNRPRLFSAEGSDFQLVPHRRVMDLGSAALRAYFSRRLNKPVQVSKVTGFILESEAQEIEAGATAVMRAALTSKPKASGVSFALSRTDNLLSTKTLTGDARIIPLAYPEQIQLTIGFLNPALQVQAV